MTAYFDFQQHIASLNDLYVASSVLMWDTRVMMPPGGAETRGYQLATLARLTHEWFASDTTARLLEAAESAIQGTDPDDYAVRAVRQTREAYEIVKRIPVALSGELASFAAVAQQVWSEAKGANDFPRFAPYLERMVGLQKQLADAMGYQEHPYDALLMRYEPGMTAARLRALFTDLRTHTLPLVQGIAAKAPPRSDFLDQDYSEDDQRAFGLSISQAMGYNLQRGRLDRSAHPFEVSFTREDVRITTRYQRRYLPAALFGIFHETGHALYEQGVAPPLTRTALTTDYLNQYAVAGVSFGAHESQSRLWENLVGRSRIFWQHHFPALQAAFTTQLAGVSAEEFYRVVNRVRPSLIRVEADELTYNFHIMLRVEIEIALLEGSLAVRDLPEMWRSTMQSTLGVTPPDDTRGVLQDIHWSTGYLGSFCTYTIGNVISVQLFEAARQQVDGLDASLAQGEYASLLAWLTENVYRHGRAYSVSELLTRATGRDLTTEPYLNYLTAKYSDLYGL